MNTDLSRAPSRLTRRQFLRLAAVAATGAVTGACTPGLTQLFSRPTAQRKQVQLVYQDWSTDWFPPMAQEMLDEFHDRNPDIHVFYVPDPDNLENQSLAALQAGTFADVFQGCCSFFPVWAQKGYTLDLRPYVEKDAPQLAIADWDPAQYNYFFTRDRKQFALPKYHGALAVYYNKDIFDSFGVYYPRNGWTYDDYLATMLRLTRDRNDALRQGLWGSMIDVSWERMQVHVNSFGGHFVDPKDPTHCLMGEPEAMAALKWLRARMWDDHCMATALDVQNMGTQPAFISGKLAMVEEGSWALKNILSNAKFRLGVVTFPAGPARHATLATSDGYAIYSGSKHTDAAWELMKFLTSKEYGLAMARTQFLQPARSSLLGDWIQHVLKQYPEQTSDIDLYAFADGQLNGYSVTTEVFADMAKATSRAYAAWDKILSLGQAPASDMEAVAREINDAQGYSPNGAGGKP